MDSFNAIDVFEDVFATPADEETKGGSGTGSYCVVA
jgi:hypothetical protein